MATFKSNKVNTGGGVQLTKVPARANVAETIEYAEYALDGSTTYADGDVIQMITIPAGATILDMCLVSEDLDSGGTPAVTLTVGDDGDVDRFILSSTIGQAGGVARLDNFAGGQYKYSAEDTIDVRLETAPATAVAGAKIKLAVTYTMA